MTLTAPPPPRPRFWGAIVAVLLAASVGLGALAALDAKMFFAVWILIFVGYVGSRAWRQPWFALSVCICLYPVMSVARPLYGAFGLPVYNSGVRCFPELTQVMVLLFLMVRHVKLRQKTTHLQFVGDDVPMLVYLVVALYSVVIGCINVHPLAPLNGWFVSVTPAVFYLLICWLKPTAVQKDNLIRTTLCVYVVVAALSFVDYFHRTDFGVALANSERPFFVPEGIPAGLYWRIYPRMQSILWEENFFAELSNIVSLFLIATLLYQKGRRTHYLTLIISLVSLLLTISRAAYMTLAIGLLVLLIQRSPNRRMVLAMIGAVALGGAVLLTTTTGAPILLRVTQRVDSLTVQNAESGGLVSDRAHHWTQAMKSFVLFPSGTGLGTAGIAAAYSKVASQSVGEGTYFRVLAEQGGIGVAAFAYLLLGTFWILWRYLPVCDPTDRPLGAAMLAFHTGFVVHAAVASTYDYYFVVPVYWIFIALFVSRTQQYLATRQVAPRPNVPLLPARTD